MRLSWAHKRDPEWDDFISQNASGGGVRLFGRVTFEMMRSFWPTPEALRQMPVVAERMNAAQKVVFSRTLRDPGWRNTRVVKGDLAAEVRRMKAEPGPDLVLMGSGTLVAQLTEARLIDSYQLVLTPVVLGSGRTLFEGVKQKLGLRLQKTRPFENGNIVLWYETM